MLFAQQGKFGAGPGPNAADGVAMAVALICVAVFLVVWLTVVIFFLMSLSKCLKEIRPRNRRMEPGQVWLNLIPCFNIVWTFITVIRVSESLTDEFDDRRLRAEGDFGKNLGITALILNLCANIPYIGILFAIGGLVCFILYWIKIVGFTRQLRDGDGETERDEDEDDRPRRRRDRDDDDEDDDRPARRRRDDDDDR